MPRAWLTTRRMLPILLAIGLIAALAAACGDDSTSTKTTPTIEVGSPIASASAEGSPSAEASPSAVTSPSAEASASAAPSGEASAPAGAATTTIDITAKDSAFDLKTITIPAGQKITVNMTNDDKLPHNFATYDKKDGTELFTGKLFPGPDKTETETFTAPAKPGNYYFQCDVHPEQMNGTLIVQ